MSGNSEMGACRLDRDAVLKGVRSLPSLPTVVVELLQSIDDDDADTQELAEKLARDQALAAKVLRVANSSFYGLQGKVESIGDAIVVLGLQGLRTLATAAAVTGTFAAGGEGAHDLRSFWRHSVAVALCAKEIARQRHMNEGNAFAAGLLHDIGRLALAACFPRHVAAVAAEREAHDDSLLAAERRLLGIDHAEIGQMLTEYWRFPTILSQAIGTHHVPDATAAPLAAVIHVADAVAHALDLAGEASTQVPPLDEAAWRHVGLGDAAWLELFEHVETQFSAACESLVS